jgi:hypothetical protein
VIVEPPPSTVIPNEPAAPDIPVKFENYFY